MQDCATKPRGDDAHGAEDGARADLDRALELDPQLVRARFARSALLGRAGRRDEARAELEYVAEHHARSKFGKKARELLERW